MTPDLDEGKEEKLGVKIMNMQSKRAYNFNAGPSALPLEVLQQAQQEMVDYNNHGLSLMEMSHRSTTYEAVHQEAMQQIKLLLDVPEEYEVLFLQGGASLQFAMIPMNFLHPEQTAAYIMTGSWSEKALKEAKVLGQTRIAATTKEAQYNRIPALSEMNLQEEDAYVHVTSNNTIYGTQWYEFPDTGSVPLIADMSSDVLSKPINMNQFGLIYAGAQKNLGPSGITVVIIHRDLLDKEREDQPSILKYSTHAKSQSLYHTPPTFAVYMLGLVMKWVQANGGVVGIQRINEQKAGLIYDAIDSSSDFYTGHALEGSRSLMNITFRLPSEELEKQFLEEADRAGFIGLNGHRSVGGCRASTYNAVTMESCQALQQFMIEFQRKHS